MRCPRGICGWWGSLDPVACLLDPADCPTEPPGCDPRCALVDCCGGPLPPIDRLDQGAILVWADGATIRIADGAKIRRQGEDRFTDLEAGGTVSVGDLIIVPQGAVFEMETVAGVVGTPEKGVSRDYEMGPQAFLITGQAALERDRLAGGREVPFRESDIEHHLYGSSWRSDYQRARGRYTMPAVEIPDAELRNKEIYLEQQRLEQQGK